MKAAETNLLDSFIIYLGIGALLGAYYLVYYRKLDDRDFETRAEMLLSIIPGAMIVIGFYKVFKDCFKYLR